MMSERGVKFGDRLLVILAGGKLFREMLRLLPVFAPIHRLTPAFSVVLIVAGCGGSDTRDVTAPLQVNAVRIGELHAPTVERSFPVVLMRERESELGARLGGVISTVRARDGDLLRKGSLVAAIRTDNLSAERARIIAVRDGLRSRVSRQQKLLGIGAISLSELEADQAELRAIEASLSAADFDIRSSQVLMPFDGVVLALRTEVGEVILPGQAIAKVADLSSPLIARAKIPSEVAMRLQRGLVMRIQLPGRQELVAAKLVRIGLASDPKTGTVNVDFVLPRSNQLVASGTIGSVLVRLINSESAIERQRLPIEALLEVDDEMAVVYVVDSNTKQARRTVTRLVGIDSDWVYICCLPIGSIIVTDGAGFVKNREVVAPRLQ